MGSSVGKIKLASSKHLYIVLGSTSLQEVNSVKDLYLYPQLPAVFLFESECTASTNYKASVDKKNDKRFKVFLKIISRPNLFPPELSFVVWIIPMSIGYVCEFVFAGKNVSLMFLSSSLGWNGAMSLNNKILGLCRPILLSSPFNHTSIIPLFIQDFLLK